MPTAWLAGYPDTVDFAYIATLLGCSRASALRTTPGLRHRGRVLRQACLKDYCRVCRQGPPKHLRRSYGGEDQVVKKGRRRPVDRPRGRFAELFQVGDGQPGRRRCVQMCPSASREKVADLLLVDGDAPTPPDHRRGGAREGVGGLTRQSFAQARDSRAGTLRWTPWTPSALDPLLKGRLVAPDRDDRVQLATLSQGRGAGGRRARRGINARRLPSCPSTSSARRSPSSATCAGGTARARRGVAAG